MTTNHERWKKRIRGCLFLGEVIEVLEANGCPDAMEVDAGHISFRQSDDDFASVTLCFPSDGPPEAYFQVGQVGGEHKWVATHETLREIAPAFVESLKASLGQETPNA